MTDDVYAPPQTEVEDRDFEVSELDEFEVSRHERLRRDHLQEERVARAIGLIFARRPASRRGQVDSPPWDSTTDRWSRATTRS